MNSSGSTVKNARHLFGFLLTVGFVLVGFYNYSLLKQTRRLENLITFLEAQKTKVVQLAESEETNTSRFVEITAASAAEKYAASNKSKVLAIPKFPLQPCKIDLWSVNWTRIGSNIIPNNLRNDTVLSNVRYGGLYMPEDCKAIERVAIIVPYRDRQEHLEVFLNYMHAFLQRQKLQYGIYIVELALPTQFNRGLLNNIGFETAQGMAEYDCFIFHDVDLLPKYIHNSYTCRDQPTHFAVRNMKYHFRLPYKGYTGGVLGIRPAVFEKVNGFSNLYFGWGREDDDFRERMLVKGYKIHRPEGRTGTYIALPHNSDISNPDNPARFELYNEGLARSGSDGLNSMMYTRLALEFRDLYTWIYVQANEAVIMKDYQNWKESMAMKKPKEIIYNITAQLKLLGIKSP